MTDLRTELADLVKALVDPYEHAQTINLRHPFDPDREGEKVMHTVRFPSLLQQLETAVSPATAAGAGGRGYESSPVARLDAIDRLYAIRAGIARYDRVENSYPATLRSLVSAEWLDDDERANLAREVGIWIVWARVVTGWETPPRRLHATCPACDTAGTLRARTEPLEACCVRCGAAWDSTTIGLLANILAAEPDDVAATAKPVISIDPTRAQGAPTIRGIDINELACALLAGGTVATVAAEYEITRPDVLVACWYLGRYSRPWRRSLHEWVTSDKVDPVISSAKPRWERIPDPPLKRIAPISEGAAAA